MFFLEIFLVYSKYKFFDSNNDFIIHIYFSDVTKNIKKHSK